LLVPITFEKLNNAKEYVALQALNAHTHRGHEFRRGQALLWLSEGESVQEIAERLEVSRQTVYNWANRFQGRHGRPLLQRLQDAKRSGRPRTAQRIIDPLIAAVIERDPCDLGYSATLWTASLLGQYLRDAHDIEVCDKSVSRAIARLGIRWKRPRPHLALRPKTWRQAKGG
jgi:Transposase and inactivated derivatives